MGIKGRMTIELADGKTGKVVERHEDDNLVTNGVKHYMANMGMLNISALYNNAAQMIQGHPNNLAIPLFGGLMLFDTAQTESVEHIFVSGGTKMTGNGINGYTSNDSVTEFGSYNSEESGWQSDGSFKQVWDFTTTQANGTIACACLCPYNYAAHGEGNSTSKVVKTNGNGMTASNPIWWAYVGVGQAKQISPRADQLFGAGFEAFPIYIDTTNNYAIMLGYKASASPLVCKYVKVAFPWDKLDIRDGVNNGGRLLGEVHDITLPSQVTTGTSVLWRPVSFLGKGADGAFYFAINKIGVNNYTFTASQPLVIVKFIVGQNDVVTCEYVLSITPSTIGETTGTWYYNSPNTIKLIGDSLFLATSTTYNALNRDKWFKINLSTGVAESVADNTASNFTSFGTAERQFIIHDSSCAYDLGQLTKIDLVAKEVTSLNTIGEGNLVGMMYGLVDDKCASLYYNGDGGNVVNSLTIYRHLHFLSTINNLESPVVKTADKTMKVTYVLRFDVEE